MAMEVEPFVPISSIPLPERNPATILCCQCAAPISGVDSVDSLCYDCVKLRVDVTEGVQRDANLHQCRDCDRWLSPPSQWVAAALESRELLSLCLRKLRGLNKVRIIDASFIWTEPHSRRIKVKITVQSEVSSGTILQQTFEVEYVVSSHQCPDCAKSYTHNTWRANVQVRQKVPHKRTFLYLEQLILEAGVHKDTINIKEVDNGIDFYFGQRNHAEKFVDFLTSVVPLRAKKSQQLISIDVHTSSKSHKFTYSIEIVPICKDDLVALPLKMARQCGNIAPLTLCYRIGTAVNFLDPSTLQTADVSPQVYWRGPFAPLADVRELTEFTIMDIEPLGPVKGRFVLAEATVRRTSDLGTNDTEYTTRTHLGGLLHPGDNALGYHLTGTNFNNSQLEDIENSKAHGSTIPDVVLVKKAYPARRKNKSRTWKLRRMNKEDGEMLPRKQDQAREEADYEMFLRDVEEDQEMRGVMNLYKAERRAEARKKKAAEDMEGVEETGETNGVEEVDGDEDGDDDSALEIPLDQLREEFEEMNMDEQ
ncbi:MAG: ribosome-binding protein [Chrysothrix sp. TS-e1954]|nr:MAG: ribosome-binding protein [Chrysothrix sp. TS-e1954]